MARAGRRGGVARKVPALLACAALLLAGLTQTRIDARADETDGIHPLLYLPSGKYLRVAALGFDELLADLIYIWSIQYYGNYHIADRYDYLEKIYDDVISELDPHYMDPYVIGSLIMTAEARTPRMALKLLDKGIERNPGEWILAFEAGFTCYNDLKDYECASRYFRKALEVPDVHPLVRRFYAESRNRTGDARASLREWAAIYETAEDEYVRRIAFNHWHDLKVESDLEALGVAAGRFHDRVGRWPQGLGELSVVDGIDRIPQDPEDREYLYDRATGRASYPGRLIVGR